MKNIEQTLEQLNKKIIDYYDNIRDIDVLPSYKKPGEIRNYLKQNFAFKNPKSLDSLIDEISEILIKGTIHSTHPRYFGLFNPSVDYSSIIADALVSAYNPQLAVWSQAPVAQEIENHVLKLIAKKFGYNPATCFANFTSGGAEANHTAVLCALTDKIHDYDKIGLYNKSQPIIYVSQEAHDSFSKIAQFTGIGRNHVREIKVNEDMQMDITYLKNQIGMDISNGFVPVMVTATAGTTSAGVIDSLEEISKICQHYNVWFHVDAAWGGAAAFSPKLKKLFRGIEQADSITCDAHKWFSVAMGTGMFFSKNSEIVTKTFRIKTAYMPANTNNAFDPYSTTMQWSRRFNGLKLFMLFANLGVGGFTKRIEQQTEMGDLLRNKLKEETGYSILNKTKLPVICFTHEKLKKDSDFDLIIEKIYERKKVWISKIVLANGKIALRACITSFMTNEDDINILVNEVNQALSHIYNA